MAVRTDPAPARRAPGAPANEPTLQGPRPRRPRPPRWSRPTTAVAATLVALLLAALMNGTGLQTAATGLPVGATRDAAMSVSAGVARAGAALGLDHPHRWLTTARDGEVGALLGIAASGTGGEVAGGRPGDGQGGTDPSDGAEGQDTGAGAADGAADGTTTPATHDRDRATRTITAEAPLEVLLAGDSLIGAVADGYGRRTVDSELVAWDKDVRISTGLARPDVLDWTLHLEQLLEARDPDVVVLLLGGNDDQSLVGGPDGVVHYGQPGWEEEYQARITDLQSIAARQGRTVVWLELPAVRPTRLEQARQRMNAAARRAAEATGVLVVDTDAILAPEGYTPRLRGVQVRAGDGVHLTHPGGDLVAEVLDRVVAERYGLPIG